MFVCPQRRNPYDGIVDEMGVTLRELAARMPPLPEDYDDGMAFALRTARAAGRGRGRGRGGRGAGGRLQVRLHVCVSTTIMTAGRLV